MQRIEQRGLFFFQQASEVNSRQYVGKGIMGVAMVYSIGRSKIFQSEAGQPIFPGGPYNALGAQCVHSPCDIDQVPSTPILTKLSGVGRKKIAVEGEARNFIIKPNRVVTQHAGSRHHKLT